MNTLSDAFLEAVDRAIDRERADRDPDRPGVDTYLGLVTGDPALAGTFAARPSASAPWSPSAKGSSATPS